MDFKRIIRHLFTTRRQVTRAFPSTALNAIEHAIATSETTHTGEIRFAVEGALDGAPLFGGQSARERAIELFAQMGVWDTEQNNGVLIYLLLADRDVEIVADRGIDAKVGQDAWEAICRAMEASFRRGDFETGVIEGIAAVTQHLVKHFPAPGAGRNELPDRPEVL